MIVAPGRRIRNDEVPLFTGDPVSCRIASPVELRPGDVKYTSGGTPLINDMRPARRNNVRLEKGAKK